MKKTLRSIPEKSKFVDESDEGNEKIVGKIAHKKTVIPIEVKTCLIREEKD